MQKPERLDFDGGAEHPSRQPQRRLPAIEQNMSLFVVVVVVFSHRLKGHVLILRCGLLAVRVGSTRRRCVSLIGSKAGSVGLEFLRSLRGHNSRSLSRKSWENSPANDLECGENIQDTLVSKLIHCFTAVFYQTPGHISSSELH